MGRFFKIPKLEDLGEIYFHKLHPSYWAEGKEKGVANEIALGEDVQQGRNKIIYPGDIVLVPRGVWHGFSSSEGAIFEEVSTTHFNDDSYYADQRINKMARDERKTRLINWGRHQFGDF